LDDVGQETFAVAMIVQWVDDIGQEANLLQI